MPITFLDNIPELQLHKVILNPKTKDPLYGEIWFYEQLLKIDKAGLVEDHWYVKWNYMLSTHPNSRKSEGQIDFLIISKYGVLVVEIKGGDINVEGSKWYYGTVEDGNNCQDPFVQVSENMHSLKSLLSDDGVFFYRAVILPHNHSFSATSPNYIGFRHQLFSGLDISNSREQEITQKVYTFLITTAKASRQKILKELYPSKDHSQIQALLFERYPEIKTKKIDQIKRALFPNVMSYGFNPDSLKTIIQNENVEIFEGLRRNKKIMVMGPPGSGKTVLARKFIANQKLMDQKGIYLCATKLLSAYMKHDLFTEHQIDQEGLIIRTFPYDVTNRGDDNRYDSIDRFIVELKGKTVDFVVVDEAQELMDKGLDVLLQKIQEEFAELRLLMLYDSQQAYMSKFIDLDIFVDCIYDIYNFTHYEFSTVYRSSQTSKINSFCSGLRDCRDANTTSLLKKELVPTEELQKRDIVSKLKEILSRANSQEDTSLEFSNVILLVESNLLVDFQHLVREFFSRHIEELTKDNIGEIPRGKIRYTTPLKFKGLEKPNVFLFLKKEICSDNMTEAYVGATRAMLGLTIYLCNI